VLAAVLATRDDDRVGTGGDHVAADLPGVVTRILVERGQSVDAGTPVVVVEAMKLFHTLLAPRAGAVAAIRAVVGATVDRGAVLVELAPADVAGARCGIPACQVALEGVGVETRG
jgi:biotin carboxyl carrier protein